MIINICKEDYTPEAKQFVFEASDKNINLPERFITLRNPATRKTMPFKFSHTDTSDSSEDIAGWNYISNCHNYKLLIIND